MPTLLTLPRAASGDAMMIASWADNGHGIEGHPPPDPDHPNGHHYVFGSDDGPSCSATLPYPGPADRCGRIHITCRICSARAVLPTTGRFDDPRSIRMPCQLWGSA